MTNRELYLRYELGLIYNDLESIAEKPEFMEKFKDWLSIPAIFKRLNEIYLRAFDEWDSLCNNNCKSLYFCDKKKGHRGQHSTCGLVWDREVRQVKKKKRKR